MAAEEEDPVQVKDEEEVVCGVDVRGLAEERLQIDLAHLLLDEVAVVDRSGVEQIARDCLDV